MAKSGKSGNYPSEWEQYVPFGDVAMPYPYDVDITAEVLDGEEIFNAAYHDREIPAQGYGRTREDCLRSLVHSTFAYFRFLSTIGGEPPNFKDNARVRDWTPKRK